MIETMWLIFLLLSIASADLDLSVGGTTRSYPLSGVVEVEGGYGLLLWGETSSPFYGYSRLALSGASAATYNSGQVAVEFFPLAFSGVRAGYESIQNDTDYASYDCKVYDCRGRYRRRFVEGELTAGAGPVFLRGKARRELWERNQNKNGSKDFIDPASGLAMNESNKTQNVYSAILGFKLDERWQLLGGVRYAVDEKDHISNFPFGALGFHYGNITARIGGGVFESEIKERKFSALGIVNWEVLPSLALH